MASAELPIALCKRAALSEVTASGAEPYWADAEPLGMSENIRGGAPAQATAVRVAWDRRELRVLFEATDSNPWATLTARDAPLYTEEVVEVFIDPFGDLLSYFEIEVNPLNAVLDLVARRSRSGYLKDFAWDCEGLKTAVSRQQNGWLAEMSIPFESMTSERVQEGSEWRVNFLRIDRPQGRERELSAWSPTRTGTFHVPGMFGRVKFVE